MSWNGTGTDNRHKGNEMGRIGWAAVARPGNRVFSRNVVKGSRFAPYVLAQSAIPVILAPSGTVDAAGVITLGTALPLTYAAGAWVYLPATALLSGIAGLYWCVFSSTTVGQVYQGVNDASVPFLPRKPANTLVAEVGTGLAFSQVLTEVKFANITLPAASMGIYGSLRITQEYLFPNNVNNKFDRSMLGGQSLHGYTRTTTIRDSLCTTVRNAGAENLQTITDTHGVNQSYLNGAQRTVNTAIDQPLVFAGQLAVATDYVVFTGFSIEVMPSDE